MSRLLVAALALLIGSTCQADLINLTIADDLVFADGVLRDANPDGPSNATIEILAAPEAESDAPSPFSTTAQFDLEVPGFGTLSDDGTDAVSQPGGSLTVTLPGGESVQLSLAEVSLSFFSLPQAILVFAQGTGFNPTPSGQEIQQTTDDPGLDTQPVSITFVGNVRSATQSTTVSSNSPPQTTVTGFTAEARGDVEDAELLLVLVPEPSTAAMIALVGLSMTRRRTARG